MVQAEAGDAAGARETLRQAAVAAKGMEQAAVISSGIDAYYKNLALTDKVRALTRIAKVQMKVGNAAGARETLGQAAVIANSMDMEPVHVKVKALTDIAEAQVEAGDAAGAREVIGKAAMAAQRQGLSTH